VIIFLAGDQPVSVKKIADLYRASYTGLSKDSWWLSAVMLVNRCGTMVVPFMTLYLTRQLHYSLAKAGIIMALFGAGAICGGFLGGRLCSLFGFYRVQLVTLIGGGTMFLLLGQMRSFPLLCICTFVLSLVNESFRPANSLAIAHYSKPENLTRSYSLNRLAINLGWALGGTLGGFIAARNYHLLFIIDGFTNIGAAILLRIFLSPARLETKVAPAKQRTGDWEAYKDLRYLLFSLLVVLYAYCFFQLFSTLPVYYAQVLHLPESRIGLTMAANGIMIGAFEMVLIYKLQHKAMPLQFVKWGALLIAASFLVFNFIPGGFALALCSTLLVTMGEMLSMPFMNTYWVARTNEHNRGQYAGLYTVAWATAQVLGPGTGSLFADRFGFTALWWLIGSISIIAAAGFWVLHLMEAPKFKLV
jgi:predicted MFS family arabinose efflux permease